MKKVKTDLRGAMSFIIMMGVISLCADMVYEGARSITGPFMYSLGASAFVVGLVAGFGELLGYGLRLLSGYIADRSKQYWTITIIGYFINLLAVPLMAFAGRWEIAAVLMLLERTGKAIRNPARDAMLSHATRRVGTGWGFGLHEALDQIGAVTGPLVVAAVFFFKGGQDYRTAFLTLGIPVAIALALVLVSRVVYANPLGFEPKKLSLRAKGLKNAYWIYLFAASCIAVGFADFPLLAYHINKTAAFSVNWIPVLYALAMGVDGIAALLFGIWFDKAGIPVLGVAVLFSMLFAPFVFLGSAAWIIVGIMLWGIGMGAQESIMRAGIAELVDSEKRASGYGVFNTVFGIAWFAGSALMGWLYDLNILALVIFSIAFQVLALPYLLLLRKNR